MQSETGFPSSHQLKSYVAFKSRLKLAARAVLSADAGLLVLAPAIPVHAAGVSAHERCTPDFEPKSSDNQRWSQVSVSNPLFDAVSSFSACILSQYRLQSMQPFYSIDLQRKLYFLSCSLKKYIYMLRVFSRLSFLLLYLSDY